jgi:hypothetical protein
VSCSRSNPLPVFNGVPEPDVWWGESGIDADIWSDPIPYATPFVNASAEAAVPLLAGDPR